MMTIRTVVSVAIAAVVVMSMPVASFGWGGPHHMISEAAVERLPAWQLELVKDQVKPFVGRYCLFPDVAGADDAKPYIMPDEKNKLRLHIPDTMESNQGVFEYYVPRVLQAFRDGKNDEAMKQFGSMTHFIEDSCCPGHVRFGMEELPKGTPAMTYLQFFTKYMDMPPDKAGKSLHMVIDGGYEGTFSMAQIKKAMETYKPRLLGAGEGEIIFHLTQRHEQMHTQAAKQLIPMLQAYGKGDKAAFATAGLAAARPGAELVADLLYSLICAGKGKVDAAEAAALPKEVNLADCAVAEGTGFTWNRMNYQGRALRNASGTFGWASEPADLKPVPLKLKMEDGSVKTFDKGYGVGGLTEYTFLLQPEVFKTFSVYVGNHAQIGKEGVCSFQVVLDGKVVADSGMLKGDAPAKLLKVELGKARKLTLRTRHEGKGALVHAVWAQPVLGK